MPAPARRDVDFPLDLCRSFPVVPLEIVDSDATLSYSPVHELRALRAGSAAAVSDATRKELLQAMAAGEVVELEIDMRAFLQIDGVHNANHLRFEKKILRRLARSFQGLPLLRDHEQQELSARAGTIRASQATAVDGGMAFDMTALVTAPWAVEALLRGNLDRFSIGWAHGGRHTIRCSFDGTPIFSECSHFPGDRIKSDDGTEHIVEFVFTEASGVEVSAVSVPAVQGTGIEAIRTALSRATQEQPLAREESMHEIAQALGLQAAASQEAILAAIAARSAAAETASRRVGELEGQLSAANQELEQLRATDAQRRIDAAFAEHADRLPVARDDQGNRIASALETRLRKLAATSLEDAIAILAAMPKQAAAEALQSVRATAEPGTPPTDVLSINPHLAKVAKQLGLTAEQIAKYGARGVQ